MNAGSPLNEIMALRAALAQAEARADAAEAEAAQAKAKASSDQAFIAYLKLEIEKLRRDLYGVRSEREARLLDQLELQLEELEATASEDELAADQAAAKSTTVAAFSRRKPVRKPFPDHLPRERVVVPAPTACPCCGSDKLCKLGETITETLESIPRQWKVIQTVRERFSCRACETITQPPAPFHTIPRAWAGPSLLAMVLFEKFGQHQPLNRQCERFAREGVKISLSTLADQVGTCAAVLKPLLTLMETHVMAAERLHGDDTTVPVLAKGRTDTGRIWVYVRDRSAGRRHRQRCSTTHAIAVASMPNSTWAALPASSRPMPSRDTTGCTMRIVSRAGSRTHPVGRTRGVNFLSWPTSRPMPGAAKTHRRSRRWRWRR
jgi:transposase